MIDVLDKGKVECVDSMGSDLTVCNAARVSFAKETEWGVDEDAKKRLDESQCHYSAECVQKLKESDENLFGILQGIITGLLLHIPRLRYESKHLFQFAHSSSNTNRGL